MCDFLWSDPEEIEEWEANPRGAGVIFGTKIVDKFLQTNKFDLIVRAHQLIMEGYKLHFGNKLITIWSAPNYCYRCNNIAAILQLDENLRTNYIALMLHLKIINKNLKKWLFLSIFFNYLFNVYHIPLSVSARRWNHRTSICPHACHAHIRRCRTAFRSDAILCMCHATGRHGKYPHCSCCRSHTS